MEKTISLPFREKINLILTIEFLRNICNFCNWRKPQFTIFVEMAITIIFVWTHKVTARLVPPTPLFCSSVIMTKHLCLYYYTLFCTVYPYEAVRTIALFDEKKNTFFILTFGPTPKRIKKTCICAQNTCILSLSLEEVRIFNLPIATHFPSKFNFK